MKTRELLTCTHVYAPIRVFCFPPSETEMAEEWIQVKPRRQTTRERLEAEPATPRSPRARAQSFTDSHEVAEKSRIGKHARREKKLEWSASKRRERDERVEKRTSQREAAAREREAAREKSGV